MSNWFDNVTFTVYRMSATTGQLVLIGSWLGSMYPMQYRPRDGDVPYMADSYESEVSDEIICIDPNVNIQKDDKVVVDGAEYRAHRIKRQQGGRLAHIEIPLSSYQP